MTSKQGQPGATGFHDRYGLTRIINARGTFTPLGVSRSSVRVGDAVAEALQHYVVIDELQDAASEGIARHIGAEAGAVTHCVAAAITLSVAAAMAGTRPDDIARLPDATGLRNRVVLPAGHAVHYGHPISQAVSLAGATPILAGNAETCPLSALESALGHPETCCLLLVSSRLIEGESIDLAAAVETAHRRGLPVIIDGAAQDLRIGELLATKADLVLVSAHKYMASPTAGLVIGRQELVQAVRAQEQGIGRGMKATKEAIVGVLCALEERAALDLDQWCQAQEDKVSRFVDRAKAIDGLMASTVADPAGMPFPRVHLSLTSGPTSMNAAALAAALKSKKPPIWVMEEKLAKGEIVLELVQTQDDEIDEILARLGAILS